MGSALRALVAAAALALGGCGSVDVTPPARAGAASSGSGGYGGEGGSDGGAPVADAGSLDAACSHSPECCGADEPLCMGACCISEDDAGWHECSGNAELGVCCAATCVLP